MNFTSTAFLLFFPIVLLLYYLIPGKFQRIWLLLASYYFYLSWNIKYGLLLICVTAISYIAGIFLSKKQNKRIFVSISIICILLILFVFKYLSFAEGLLSSALSLFNINVSFTVFDIVLPVGISFYSFQAIGYVIDVYRGDIEPEKNILKYALFLSFFPQLVAGPIERSKNLLSQLEGEKRFDINYVREGFLLMLWGFFLKLVIADRVAIVVDAVYGKPSDFAGWYVIVATILFAIQIYCDFYGYSTIAVGAAKMLGINLMENFNAPYLAPSVADFWRRWHISLTSWFKDYVYIPLGGNRKGKFRKYLNLLIVFSLSGLWHGANLSFVVWGILNGIYQVIGDILSPIKKKCIQLFKISTDTISYKSFLALKTFVLVDFAWIFFRASNITEAFQIIKNMFAINNIWVLLDGEIYDLLDRKNWYLMVISIVILMVADIFQCYGVCLRDILLKQNLLFRYLFVALVITFILTYGVWGATYNEATFIYFQF